MTPRKKPARPRRQHQKRPLTPNQRLAIERRRSERCVREHLERIRQQLSGELPSRPVPENYRATVANALSVIVSGGHLFAIACAKAMVARTWPLRHDSPELWAFIDEQNAYFAAFAERTPKGGGWGWDEPDYDLPATQASEGGAR